MELHIPRYYITDRHALGGLPELLSAIDAAVRDGVEFVQIREKDLSAQDLLRLAREALRIAQGGQTKLLINDRADVALAAGAHGVHLRSNSIPPFELRRAFGDLTIAVSTHTVPEAVTAEKEGADLIVFGPVFASPGKGSPLGIPALREAAAAVSIPIFALGGVAPSNIEECRMAGAAGVAGIRLFQKRP